VKEITGWTGPQEGWGPQNKRDGEKGERRTRVAAMLREVSEVARRPARGRKKKGKGPGRGVTF